MRNVINAYRCNGTTALYRQEVSTGIVELVLVPSGMEQQVVRDDCAAEPLVQAKLVGDDYPFGFSQGRTMRNSATVNAMQFTAQRARIDTGTDDDSSDDHVWHEVPQSHDSTVAAGTVTADHDVVVETTLTDPRGYAYVHTLRMGMDSRAVEISTAIENHADHPIILEMLSSFSLGSLSPFATGLAQETLRLHRLRSTWSAEGRLISEPVENEQLEPSWQRFSANSIRFGSVGSFPVRQYAPFVGIEDVASGVTWAAATTHASSWQIEAYRRDEGLSISGGIADREFGHWIRTIQPDERFESPYAVVAVTKGGVDEAAQAVAGNVHHRLSLPESEQRMPVLFNEFCTTWGVPTEQSVNEQINFLRKMRCSDTEQGIGYFVIDAGWFDDKAFESASHFGSWEISPSHFPHGMKTVVDHVHAAGMKAGIWFEFEIAGREDSECFNKAGWLLSRDGISITSGNRRWWDMRNPDVRAYLKTKVIDFLKKNKFDYIKVDYNDTIGIGCATPDGESGDHDSLGDGLYEQIKASQEFFREMKREVPGLIVEVCASGGHRLVQSFMEIGSMASFSDAHECDEIPIIAANMHRMILPRQSQIWAVVKHDQPLKKLYYQVASGLLGRLCFSGDTASLRDEQVDLIRKAITWYGKAAPVIDNGESHWFGPHIVSYRHPCGWQAIVRNGELNTPAEGQTLVVLHTFHDAPSRITVPVTGINRQETTDIWARSGIDVVVGDGVLEITGIEPFDGLAVLL